MDSQSPTQPVDAPPPPDADEARRRELAALLIRAREGDRGALDEIVDRMNLLVWNVARAQGLGREAAADVVQSTWVALLENLHTIRSPDALAAWLVTVTRRDARRARIAERRVDLVSPEHFVDLPAAFDNFENDIAEREQHRTLWVNLQKLPARCRELLRILAFTGRTEYRAVIEVLDMPKGSIGPTRSRCVRKLRDLLRNDPSWSPE